MGTCKCNQTSIVPRSDLFVPNIDIESNQVHPTKLLRLKTVNDYTVVENKAFIAVSTEQFIREKSSLYRSDNKESPYKEARDRATMKQNNKNSENNRRQSEKMNSSPNHSLPQKVQSISCEVEEKTFTSKEEKFIANILLHHFLFSKATHKILNELFEEISEYQIDAGSSIFLENDDGGYMFIIKTGQVELYSNDVKLRILKNPGDAFGELALVNVNASRKYNAKAITNLSFYVIASEDFSIVFEELLGERKYHIPFFQHIEKEYRENLELMIVEIDLKAGHVASDNEGIFGVIEGKLNLVDKNNNIITTYHPTDISGMSLLISAKNEEYQIVVAKASKCYFLPIQAFSEVCGLNYQFLILYSYFKIAMLSNNFFGPFCKETKLKQLYTIFKFVEYSPESVVYCASGNKKIMLLIDGEIVYLNSKKIALFQGKVFGEEIIDEDEYIDDMIAQKTSFVLECDWKDFCQQAFLNGQPYNEIINKLKEIYMLNHLKEKNLIKIAKVLEKSHYKKGDKIISEDSPCDRYHLINLGEVKEVHKGKTLRYYNQNNSFGEMNLLNDNTPTTAVVAVSKEVSLFYIRKDLFLNMLTHPDINRYIKNKLCNEDSEIFLKSLYYLQTIYKGKKANVYLVHNQISQYVIKAIQLSEKKSHHIPNLINEKKASVHLDHPFIIHYIKTLKTQKWCFFLEEYVYGITLEEYLEMCNLYQEKSNIRFYGASLLIILNYLMSIRIIHRNIIPSNILIETTGYIKLLDFTSSKRLKEDCTKTIIGTPLFIAPEVLGGKGYSYSCDYWSVGICLYYLYYGSFPFGSKAKVPGDVFKEILNKKLSFKNEKEDDGDIQELLSILLNKKPAERCIDMNKLKECSLFHNFNWEMLIRMKLNPPFLPQVVDIATEKMIHNLITPFNTFIEKEKVDDDSNTLIRLHKDIIITTQNEERNVQSNWFNDF